MEWARDGTDKSHEHFLIISHNYATLK